jgi:PPOX class probable F420-dependent enzyme
MVEHERAAIPSDLAYLLTSDVVATVAAQRGDGTIAQYQMWVDYDGENVLVSSAVGSRKAANWARDPNVTVSVVDHADPWRFLVIRGRVVETKPDTGLEHIDRTSMRYVGAPYRRRNLQREIFRIEPDHVLARRGRGS